MSFSEFNQYFGAVPSPSRKYIQSPASWSVGRFDKNIENNNEFQRACRFKWAFRIKPDLVVQPNPDQALCVEAKWDSRESSYPTAASEIAVFKRRGLLRDHAGKPLRSQTAVQQFMMDKILGIDTHFVYLVRQRNSRETHHETQEGKHHETFTWDEAFGMLDLSSSPPFILRWVKRLSEKP